MTNVKILMENYINFTYCISPKFCPFKDGVGLCGEGFPRRFMDFHPLSSPEAIPISPKQIDNFNEEIISWRKFIIITTSCYDFISFSLLTKIHVGPK